MQDASNVESWSSTTRLKSRCFRTAVAVQLVLIFVLVAQAAGNHEATLDDYEGRAVSDIEIVFEGSPADPATQTEFLTLLRVSPNSEYSAVRIHDSLVSLFESGRVANARVEVIESSSAKTGPIRLRFVIQRQVQIGSVRLDLGPVTGSPISTDELRARLNFVQPGTRLTKQIIARNADEIQVYLRDRGYFNATVESAEDIDSSGVRATVTYRITPGEQSRVEAFVIAIDSFNSAAIKDSLALQPGAPFTREALAADLTKIRQSMIAEGFLSPILEDPRVERDPEKNTIKVQLTGHKGPRVNVIVKNYELSEKTQKELFPVKREGSIDFSAIVEGARRLRNKLQEDGYFFADVTETCTVSNPPAELGPNGTEETCQNLNPALLNGQTVEVNYSVDQGRRFRLNDIRITGTNKITYADVEADLKS